MKRAIDILKREVANEKAEYDNAVQRFGKKSGNPVLDAHFGEYLLELGKAVKEMEDALELLEDVEGGELSKEEMKILHTKNAPETYGAKLLTLKNQEHEQEEGHQFRPDHQ
jgi:hypothetical protein